MSKSRRERRAAERQAAKASVASGSGAASQGSGDSRESLSERTREGDRVSVGDLGDTHQEKSTDIQARLRARAREVDSSDHRARVRFCRTTGPEYQELGKEVSFILAEVWGLKVSTVQRDMSIAYAESQEAAEGVDHAIWWRGMYDLLEEAIADGRLVSESIENLRGDDGRLILSPMDLKMVSDAQGRARDSVIKVRESMGKALGLMGSGADVSISIDVGDQKVKVAADQAKRILMSSLAFFDDEERRTPGIRGRYLEWIGLVDVPMLPGGG